MFVARTLLLVCILPVMALAQGESKNNYQQISLKELVSRPADFQGQMVTISAEIVSVSADYRSVDVFDARSKTLVGVSLAQLPKAQRYALVNEPVHRVLVSGRFEMKHGRAVMRADKIVPLETTLVAGR